jgi:hypothetical protein
MKTSSKLTAIFLAVFATAAQAATYVITGSGTSFTAAKGNPSASVAADKPIQAVIDAIKADAQGEECTIQFGDGTSVLDIGAANITFKGRNWDVITLAGKITSSNADSTVGTIYLTDTASIESTADIANTGGEKGRAIYNNSRGAVNIIGGEVKATTGYAVYNYIAGTVNISGGTVSATSGYAVYIRQGRANISGGEVKATTGYAVYNYATSTVMNISGGTISATSGYAVYNARTLNISGGEVKATSGYAVHNNNSSSGTVNISGGTVSATTGTAVYDTYGGKITVAGSAKVTSANTTAAQGTIFLASSGTATAARLEITGGTVENTAANANARAIYNASTGAVNISGGLVLAKDGYAIYKSGSGATAITGGLAFAYGTGAANVIYGTYTATSGDAVVLAWNKAANNTAYTENTSTNIAKSPESATAVWLSKDGKAGIDYANGENIGFLAIDGVTVNAPSSSSSGTVATSSSAAATTSSSSSDGASPSSSSNGTNPSSSSDGASPSSSSVDGTPIRSPQIAGGNIRVHTTSNAIVLENLPKGAKVEVYNLQGKQVYSTHSENSKILRILVQTKGVYLVKTGSQTMRTVVR